MLSRTVSVSKLFVLEQDRQVIAHLQSFEWDFAPGDVRLKCGDEAVAFRQVGSGNHEGNAVVSLSAIGSWKDAAAYVRRLQKQSGTVTIER